MVISLVAIIVLSVAVLRIFRAQRRDSESLVAATLITSILLELFDLFALSGFAPQIPWKTFSVFIEGLLPLVWLGCSLTHDRDSDEGPDRWMAAIMGGSCLLIALATILPSPLYYAPDFPNERVLFLTDTGYYYYLGILVVLVAALTNFEATLVNASTEMRWRVKLEVVALGSMLAVLIFYYSSALLHRTINMELVPLRSLLFVVAAIILAYSRSHWRGPARVKVSQKVLLRSVSLAFVGGYLLLLGVLGKGMTYFGPQFPHVLMLSLGFLAGMLLLLIVLSERLKRELKVFLHKNFFQSKFDYRAQWLGITERLATFESGEELLKRVLRAYCDIFGMKGSALFLHQDGCGWFCATAIGDMDDLDETIADDNPLPVHLQATRWIFSSKENNSELMAQNRRLIDRYKISFVIPLFESDNLAGFIALGEQVVPDEEYGYEDFDLMKTIASQASIAILHQRLSERLTQAKAMEAVGNLATFVAHDLKNLAATISLIVDNAKKHLDNPEFQDDMLSSLGNTSQQMHLLISHLRNLGDRELFHMRPVDLLKVVERSVLVLQGGLKSSQSAAIKVQGDRQTAMADEQELEKALSNLLLNAIEASPEGSPILAEVGFAGAPYIRITDKGCGMSPLFVRRELFAPFRSTKVKGLGIGVYQCREIVAAHGGRIEVSSAEGAGTAFTIWLPEPGGEAPDPGPGNLKGVPCKNC